MKKLIVGLVLLLSAVSFAQEGVSIGIHQDYKMAFKGDPDRDYEAPVANFLVRMKLMSVETETGYLSIFPEFEYADIDGDYYRYSFNVGYTFNTFHRRLEVTPYIGIGFIDRFGKSFYSFGAGTDVGITIFKNFKFVNTVQLTDRRDLGYFWDSYKIGISVFGGFEYKFM